MKLAALVNQLPLMTAPCSPLITLAHTPIESNSAPHPRRCYIGRVGALMEAARELFEDPEAEVHCVTPFSTGLERTARIQLSSSSDLLQEEHSPHLTSAMLQDSLLFQKKLNKAIFYGTEEIAFVHSGRIKHFTPAHTTIAHLEQLEESPSERAHLSLQERRTQTLFKEKVILPCIKEEEGGYIKPFAPLLISVYLQNTYPTRFHLHQDSISSLAFDPTSKKYHVSIGSCPDRSLNQIFNSAVITSSEGAPFEIKQPEHQMTPLWQTHRLVEVFSLWTMSADRNELEKRFDTSLRTEREIKTALRRLLPWKTSCGLLATPLSSSSSLDHIHITTHISTRLVQDSLEKTYKRIESYLESYNIGNWQMLPSSLGMTCYDITPACDLPEYMRPISMNWGPLETSVAGARIHL